MPDVLLESGYIRASGFLGKWFCSVHEWGFLGSNRGTGVLVWLHEKVAENGKYGLTGAMLYIHNSTNNSNKSQKYLTILKIKEKVKSVMEVKGYV